MLGGISMDLINYAKGTNQTVQEAFEQCRKIGALFTKGSRILVNLNKVNRYLDKEIILTLFSIKEGEIR